MPERSHARYLAPIVLVAIILAVVAVVVTTGSDSSSSKKAATTTAAGPKTKSGKPKKFYRVKPGDLLSEISDKTSVDIQTIIKLNPDVDPQALQAGQLIRIRK